MHYIENLEDISDTVSSPDFTDGRLSRYVLREKEAFPKPSPLFCEDPDATADWLIKWHRQPGLPPPSAISCYFAKDAVISGRGHIWLGGDVLISDEFMPPYWRHLILHGGSAIRLEIEDSLPARRVDEPSVVFTGHGIHVYGHLLIEMLPKLHMIRRDLNKILPHYKILMDSTAPAWFLDVIKSAYEIDENDLIRFDPAKEKIVLRHAILPALCSRDGHLLAYNNETFDFLVGKFAAPCKIERVFISRAFFENSHSMQRRCDNELELATIAAREFNFTTIAPETLPWVEQVRVFSSARFVLGEFGSGLHNALFAPRRSTVGVIGFNNLTQSFIAALRGQDIGYLKTKEVSANRYKIDTESFRVFVDRMLSSRPKAAAVAQERVALAEKTDTLDDSAAPARGSSANASVGIPPSTTDSCVWSYVRSVSCLEPGREFGSPVVLNSRDPRLQSYGVTIEGDDCTVTLASAAPGRLGVIRIFASGRGCAVMIDNEEWQGVLNANVRLAGHNSLAVLCNPLGRQTHLCDVFLRGQGSGFFFGRGASAVGLHVEIEGTNRCIVIGDDALISNDVWIRNYDMHGIHGLQSGQQLNRPCDTVLEPHVWLGQEALLLGCERVGFGSIVGARSLVRRAVDSRTIVAGVPARVLRRDVSWSRAVNDLSQEERDLLTQLAASAPQAALPPGGKGGV